MFAYYLCLKLNLLPIWIGFLSALNVVMLNKHFSTPIKIISSVLYIVRATSVWGDRDEHPLVNDLTMKRSCEKGSNGFIKALFCVQHQSRHQCKTLFACTRTHEINDDSDHCKLFSFVADVLWTLFISHFEDSLFFVCKADS